MKAAYDEFTLPGGLPVHIRRVGDTDTYDVSVGGRKPVYGFLIGEIEDTASGWRAELYGPDEIVDGGVFATRREAVRWLHGMMLAHDPAYNRWVDSLHRAQLRNTQRRAA